MRRKFPYLIFYIGCLLLAIAAHTVFLVQWARNHYMVGINDGISQMLPFKQLLYEQYTSGEFFYSFDFGLGAGTFSELSYYFSTSLVFLITVLAIHLLEIMGAVQSADVLFWANAAVFISVFRLSFILFITARLFMYMGISKIPSLLGASFYGISAMYFRHTVYWEFFADAFLWLPLLLFGIEKIFREQKPGWFLFAVSISLIDNFYFSYINFLLAGIYILFRLFIRLTAREPSILKIIGTFLATGIIGAGISAVSFIPAVYAYLNNHRPPFQQEIPWIDLSDNILFTSRYIVVPAVFLLFLFCTALYRNKTFRLFALLGAAGILLHYSPLVGSAFNGFSAPQYRWEYFISLVIGGAVAIGIEQLKKVTITQLFVSGAVTVAAYALIVGLDENFEKDSLNSTFTLSCLLLTFLLVLAALKWRNKRVKFALIFFLAVSNIAFVNLYQFEQVLEYGNIEEVNKELLTGEDYNDPEILSLIEEIEQRDNGPAYRIDWMEGVRNNTPIVQDFRGLSAYSSILNKNLLYFYLYDLEIDMGRESVSRYATLGNRANLHSLLQGKYSIVEKGDSNVPYGFTRISSSDNYEVYENNNSLPFARSTSTVFQEQQLADAHPLIREHAMLEGVILDNGDAPAPLPNIGDQAVQLMALEEKEASYENGKLTIHGDTGGIDLQLDTAQFTEGDLYISFHLESSSPTEGFALTVNDYSTTRKSNDSVYKTFVDDLTIRIPAADTVEIRLPKGTYTLTELQVHGESYDVLLSQKEQYSGLENLQMDGSRVQITYDNLENNAYLATAIPYERGWSAKINGEKRDVLKANYGFLAVPIEDGKNNVILTYRPPFFKLSLIISVLSLIIGALFVFRKNKRA